MMLPHDCRWCDCLSLTKIDEEAAEKTKLQYGIAVVARLADWIYTLVWGY